MIPIENNGWKIYFHPEYASQREKLENQVIKLSGRLSEEKYLNHSTVKLFASLVRLEDVLIPNNPLDSSFALKNELKGYSRVKGKGLDSRRRLFFKVFKDEKNIFILWLGYPRKDGAKDDCYTVFKKMVSRGLFPKSIDEMFKGFRKR